MSPVATKKFTKKKAQKTAAQPGAMKVTAAATAKKTTKKVSSKAAKKVSSKAAKKTKAKGSSGSTGKPQTLASKRGAAKAQREPSVALKPTTIDEYLSTLDADKRQLLEDLRRVILRIVPDAQECISYSMPAFRWQRRVIAGFLATRDGASYYPFSGTTVGTLASVLVGYKQTKSGVHFTREKPLTSELVRQLIEARRAEVDH